MNQFTCTNERMDCSLSLPVKKPRHRKRRTHKDDDCDCSGSAEEEGRNTRRVSQNRRNDIVPEETPDCSYSGTLTDDECVCEDEVQQARARNRSEKERTSRDVENNGDGRIHEGRQMNMPEEHPLGASGRQWNGRRRRGTADISRRRANGNSEEEDAAISQAVDDIYRELEDENPGRSRNNEKELKEWIKRCQEECKQRNKRRG